jgi:hypothetical protein
VSDKKPTQSLHGAFCIAALEFIQDTPIVNISVMNVNSLKLLNGFCNELNYVTALFSHLYI